MLLPIRVIVMEIVHLLVISLVVVVDPVNFYILKNKKITTMYNVFKGAVLFMKIAIYGFGNVGKWMCRRLLNSQKFISDISIYVYDDMKKTTELNLSLIHI